MTDKGMADKDMMDAIRELFNDGRDGDGPDSVRVGGDTLEEHIEKLEEFTQKHGPATIITGDGKKIVAKRIVAYYSGATVYDAEGNLISETDWITMGRFMHGPMDLPFVVGMSEATIEALGKMRS